VEAVAYQHALLYWAGHVMQQYQIEGIQFVDIYPGANSKNYRINTMIRSLSAGEIVLHPSVRSQVTHQISNWNPMKRDNVDDILDLLCYAPKVVEIYGFILDVTEDFREPEAKVIEWNSAF
jgi:hypothetical protein